MALYTYDALNKEGKKVSGSLDATSISFAREQLSRQGLFPISITPKQAFSQTFWSRFFSRGVSFKEKILFTRQLMILLKSGVQLLQAFEILVDQFEGRLRSILVSVKDDIKGGSSLADALKKYPYVFETIYIQLIKAGESSGQLDIILKRLVEYLDRREAVKKKISEAMRGPLIQLAVSGVIVLGLVAFVIPKMVESFGQEGAQLPLPTRILMGLSSIILNHYFLLLSVIFSIVLAYRYWKSTPQGARIRDTVLLKIPVVGFIAKMNAVVQFSYALGMLLEGGVHLPEALDVVVNIVDNRILADALRQARDNIVKQGKIAQYLRQSGIFPPIACYLIETGEQSGELGSMLLTVAQIYEGEISELTDTLTALLGPIMLIVMAVIVGFIVISIILPIMQMQQMVGA